MYHLERSHAVMRSGTLTNPPCAACMAKIRGADVSCSPDLGTAASSSLSLTKAG